MKKSDAIPELIDELNALSQHIMAANLEVMYHSPDFATLSKIELLQKLIEPEYSAKMDRQFNTRLNSSGLKGASQSLATCQNSSERIYLPADIIDVLKTLDFVRDGLNVCILGASDSGKTYLAKALAIQACKQYKVEYHSFEHFIVSLADLKERDFSAYEKAMQATLKKDLLVLDDFLLNTVTEEREIKVLFEVLNTRIEKSKSTVICSQREPDSWKTMILNDQVTANAIMKRATKHYTVVIQLKE